jgi:hypothetical protein
MNFKTTLILAVVLLGLGAYIFFTRDHGGEKTKPDEVTDATERKLFEVKPEDVTKITVTPADGKRMVLVKGTDGKWQILEPVSAPAEAFEVDSLARSLAELKSHGRVSSGDTAATGLSSPKYKVEFVTSDNKSHALAVGSKSAVGDNLYVAVADAKQPDVVGTELLDRLEKPASGYRDPKIVRMTTSDVRQVTIARGDTTIKLAKSGNDWRVTEPKAMPADSTEVDDVIFAVAGLRASEWVAEDQKDAKQYQLDKPRVTVTLSATTQPVHATTATSTPATSQPTVVKIGRYDDVLRKNVLLTSSDSPAVAKAPASIIDTLNKKPIEFRDKKVLAISPDQVAAIAILSDVPATTRPTTKPASKSEVKIKRHVPTLPIGIAAPTTQMAPAAAATSKPSTAPASMQQASTQPASRPTMATTQPESKWELVGDKTQPAVETKVDDLIAALNPLRADKFLDAKPATTQPAATYTLKITTQAAGGAPAVEQTVTIVDADETKSPVGSFEDLSFEVSRSTLDKLKQDFSKASAPAPNIANTPMPNPGFPESP